MVEVTHFAAIGTQKKPPRFGVAFFDETKREFCELTLRELEALASTGLSRLFTLFHSWVTC